MTNANAHYLSKTLKSVIGVFVATFFYNFFEAIAREMPDVAGLIVIWLTAIAVAYFLIRIYGDRAKIYAALVAVLMLILDGLAFYKLMWRLGLDSSKSADVLIGMLKHPGYLPSLLFVILLPLLMVWVLDRFLKKGRASSTHLESRA